MPTTTSHVAAGNGHVEIEEAAKLEEAVDALAVDGIRARMIERITELETEAARLRCALYALKPWPGRPPRHPSE